MMMRFVFPLASLSKKTVYFWSSLPFSAQLMMFFSSFGRTQPLLCVPRLILFSADFIILLLHALVYRCEAENASKIRPFLIRVFGVVFVDQPVAGNLYAPYL